MKDNAIAIAIAITIEYITKRQQINNRKRETKQIFRKHEKTFEECVYCYLLHGT